MTIIIFLMVGTLLPGLSVQQCFSADDFNQQSSPNSRQALYYGQQAFSLAMLKEAVAANPKGNVFFSPYSVYNALLLAYFGAANQTENSLRTILRIPDTETKSSMMRAYKLEKYFENIRELNGTESYELKSANKLFVAEGMKLRDCITEIFQDEVQPLNFVQNPEAARENINNWVETLTKRQIKDLLPYGKISYNTEMVLANAAYFKGLWQSQFLQEHTHKDVFYIQNSNYAFVDMMKQNGTFNHIVSERLGAHILELPYKGNKISMFIILPPFATYEQRLQQKSNGIESVVNQLSVENLEEIIQDDLPRAVKVIIPKFTVEETMELTPILERLGVGDLFQNTADLSGFTGEKGLKFDEAIHKAKVSVDEKGTVAAAATAIFSFRSSRPLTPAIFNANHPFIYLIYEKEPQRILFMGVYRSPNKKDSS